jgi:hypothetical protein
MATKIQLRRDTAANWEASNPVLSQGEPGFEIDTGKVKHGDGVTDWRKLAYQGDFSVTPTDGVNDNQWQIVNVKGYKEFDYQTEGNLKIHIPITAEMEGTVSQVTVNLAGQDLTALRDSYDVGSNIRVYLNDQRVDTYPVWDIDGTGFTPNEGPGSLGANEYRIKWNGGDLTLVEGEELTLQYFTRGTKDLYGAWNEEGSFVPDETAANTNQVVLDFTTFNYLNANSITALNIHTSNCSIRFWTSNNNQLDTTRKIVSVDNTENLYTITFDGAPLDVVTPTLTTLDVTHARNTSGDNTYIEFDSKRYPEFSDCIYTQNNKYTGNINRSGYIVINSDTGNPYDFQNSGYINNEGMFVIQLGTTYSISPSDTVHIHYYRAPTNIALYTYEPEQQTNRYYGKKWFDWTADLPRRYYNQAGNGVQGGTMKTQVALYDQATKSWVSAHFPMNAFTQYDYDNWFVNNYYDMYPFDNFDEEGIYFYTDWTGADGDSRSLKIRIMYSMELMVAEFDPSWGP